MDALIPALGGFYGTIRISRAADFYRLLQAPEAMAIRTDQSLEEAHAISAHGISSAQLKWCAM
jgi:hypothetical protein